MCLPRFTRELYGHAYQVNRETFEYIMVDRATYGIRVYLKESVNMVESQVMMNYFPSNIL